MLDLSEHSWCLHVLYYFFKDIVTFLQSLWVSTMQIIQHRHSYSRQYKLNFSWCSSQCPLISNTYDGSFWYSSIDIVVWFRDGLAKLWYSMHSVQRPSSHCGHQSSDGLEIWRISHIPQKDGELDMMLISCNILHVLK